MTEARLHCRICESACGLVAEIVDGRVAKLRPDPTHPVSHGYACPKGVRFTEQLNRPDRLRAPTLGGLPADWARALRTIGAQLRGIRAKHGRDHVALYLGNAAGHSLGALLGASVLQRALGTRRSYSCLTLDNAGQFVVLDQVYGNAMHTFIADYEHSDCVVLFGTDPLASQPSQAQANPGGVRHLLRHPNLVVIDPRRSTTARAARVHLAPRPGGDVELIGHLVACVIAARRPDGEGWARIAAAVAPFTLARAAGATGLDPAAIGGLAETLLGAARPLAWSGLGVLLGRDGTLGYWLTLVLQAALGGVEAPGGWRSGLGGLDLAPLLRLTGVKASDPANLGSGGHPATLGTLPAASLADDILAGDVRALVVVGGNPARALPALPRARAALGALDALVVLDAFPSATTALATAVLPVALWPERYDANVHAANQRPTQHLDRSEPAVPPPDGCREDWDILTALAAELGAPWRLARWLTPRRLASLAALAPPPPAGTPPTGDQLAVARFLDALGARETRQPAMVLLTSARPILSMNTWLGPPSRPSVHPLDLAAAAGLTSGLLPDLVGDSNLPRGVLVVPFGDGRANELTRCDDLDPFTGVPVFNGCRLG